MDTVQVVIKINRSLYNKIMDDIKISESDVSVLQQRVYEGTELPKHGKLIDADDVVKRYAISKNTDALKGDDDAFLKAIKETDTILEATDTAS